MAFGSPNSIYDSPATSVLADESARTFMQRVYGWMTAGLFLSGGVAFAVASSRAAVAAVMPWFYPIMFAEFAAVVAFSFLAPRVSGAVAALLFLAYAGLNGLTLSVVFLAFKLGSITSALFVTGGAFAAMSAYGTLTKKDLSSWGTFLFMGVIGIVLAGIANIFIQSDLLMFVKSCAGVLVFAGLTAYDTQKLRTFHASSGYSSAGSLAISGALTLYLDFVNLFLNLLMLFGRRR